MLRSCSTDNIVSLDAIGLAPGAHDESIVVGNDCDDVHSF